MVILDINNRCIHPWSRTNLDRLPLNFLKRYNRFIGAVGVTGEKFLIFTNYSVITLDISRNLDSDTTRKVTIKENSVSKETDASSAWFDHLKQSQEKYISSHLNQRYA
mmetsp:Transcript_1680/g.2968  ORF Transcript_1680/g.2968 Transcript_1680/m.2968 type:complete len:108 (+) Transcript_1680:992-1315(+)